MTVTHPERKAARLCKGIFDALLVLLIVGAVVLLLAPRLLGAKLLVVLSQSMEPTIPMGAIVISRPVPAAEIEAGDVITFRSSGPSGGGDLITHRVVELVGSGIGARFRTQGDAVEEPDMDLVQPINVIGRVWLSVPYLGYAAHFARTPLGFALLMGLPAALLVGGEARSMVRAAKGKTERAPEPMPSNSPLLENEQEQARPAPLIGEKLKSVVRAAREKIVSAPARIPLDLSTLKRDSDRTPPVTLARSAPSWQQVQALQAQVEALQAEVAALRRRLEQIAPDASPLPAPESAHVRPHPQQAPPRPASSDQQRRTRQATPGHPPIIPPDVKMLPAPQLTQPMTGEWLAASLVRWAWLGILASLTAIFLMIHFALPQTLSTWLNTYVVQPLLWSCLAVQSFLCWRYGLDAQPTLHKPLVLMAALTGAFQVALFVIAGLFFGFERLSQGGRPLAWLGKLVHVGAMLAGLEMARAYLVVAFNQRNPRLAPIVLALFFSLVSLPPANFGALNSVTAVLRACGETLLPALCQNLLASFLALSGGPAAPVAYRGIVLAFERLSPLQPGPPWGVTALLGSVVPLLGLLAIRNRGRPRTVREKGQSSAPAAPTGWPAALFVAGQMGGVARTPGERQSRQVAEMATGIVGEER